jgi:hypothetical protein
MSFRNSGTGFEQSIPHFRIIQPYLSKDWQILIMSIRKSVRLFKELETAVVAFR